jgi:Cdc6-like AAA superfamily ATPase
LYDTWSPPTLLYRDKELAQMLNYTTEAPIPCNLWIEGEKGLGKSLTCKFFCQEVEARGRGTAFYIQCGSSFKSSIKEICEKRGLRVTFRDLNPIGVVKSILKWRPEEDTFFLIIDDPERVRDTRAVDDFIRDAYDTFLNNGRRHATIVASRLSVRKASEIFECLRSDSRLHPTPIVFRPYTTEEIVQILRQRLHYSFECDDLYDLHAVYVIARHVSRIGSDIREALEILRRAVLHIAKEKLTTREAEEAVEWAKKSWWKEKLQALPPHWAFLLYTAAKIARRSEEGVVEADAYEVVGKYKGELRKPEIGADPLGKTSIYHALKRMSDIHGFFTIEKARNKGREILKLRFDEGEARHIVQAGDEMDWLTLSSSQIK